MQVQMVYTIGEHGVVVRAFVLYWGGVRFESLPTQHCWASNKFFIPSLVVNEKIQRIWRLVAVKTKRVAVSVRPL